MSEAILTRLLRSQGASEEDINELVQKIANRDPPLEQAQEDELCAQLKGIEEIISDIPRNYPFLQHRWMKRAIVVWNKFCKIEQVPPKADVWWEWDKDWEAEWKVVRQPEKRKIEDDPPMDDEEMMKWMTDDEWEEEEEEKPSKKRKIEEEQSKAGEKGTKRKVDDEEEDEDKSKKMKTEETSSKPGCSSWSSSKLDSKSKF